jgi:hypothetical protein
MDPGDPVTWRSCMPGLGRTVSEGNVAADWQAMSQSGEIADFCAEYLGWWPQDRQAVWTLVGEPVWTGLRDFESQIESGMSLAIDVDPERNSGAIAAAGKRADGDRHVEIIEPGGLISPATAGIDWMGPRILELIDRWSPMCVVLDPRSPARSFLPEIERTGVKVVKPNALDVAGACATFFDATGQAIADADASAFIDDPGWRLHHLGQETLDKAVATARKLSSPTNGTFVFVRTGLRTSISPLYAGALALWGYEANSFLDYDVTADIA